MVGFMRRHPRFTNQTLGTLRRALTSYSSASPQYGSCTYEIASVILRSSNESGSPKIATTENETVSLTSSLSSSSFSSFLPPGSYRRSCSVNYFGGRDLEQQHHSECRSTAIEDAIIWFSYPLYGDRRTVAMAQPNLAFSVMSHILVETPSIRKDYGLLSQYSTSRIGNIFEKLPPLIVHPTLMESSQRASFHVYSIGLCCHSVDAGIRVQQLQLGKLIQQLVKASDTESSNKSTNAGKAKIVMPGLQHQNIPLEASSVKRKRKKKMNKHKQRKLRRRDRHRK